jgi:hypothetical protein
MVRQRLLGAIAKVDPQMHTVMSQRSRTVLLLLSSLACCVTAANAQRQPTLVPRAKAVESVAGVHFGGRVVNDHGGRGRSANHQHSDCCRVWIPARCETVTERHWVPARCERVWVPPVFDVVVERCGRQRRVCLREGYWQVVEHPGRWECVTRQVEIPGRWENRCGR